MLDKSLLKAYLSPAAHKGMMPEKLILFPWQNVLESWSCTVLSRKGFMQNACTLCHKQQSL